MIDKVLRDKDYFVHFTVVNTKSWLTLNHGFEKIVMLKRNPEFFRLSKAMKGLHTIFFT